LIVEGHTDLSLCYVIAHASIVTIGGF